MNKLICLKREERLGTILKITLLSLLLMPGASFAWANNSLGQVKISIERKSVKIKVVLKDIEKQCELRFFYNPRRVDVTRVVTVDFHYAPLEEALDKIFEGTAIRYEFRGRQVLLFPEQKEEEESVDATQSASPDKVVSVTKKEISGVVTDEKNQPMAGVNVIEKDTSNGAVTDINGQYKLQVSDETSVLVFSFIGYLPQEISVNAQTKINVQMQQDIVTLNDVIVVGYGTENRKDLTGAISSVKNEDMNLGGSTLNVAQAIQGRAAGVRVQQADNSPGGVISVTIRGGNSINSTNEPLYVVDGLISANGNTINPNDIEDIQILKDASAAAIYGARGANGVVLITTKKGKAGKMTIEADLSQGVQSSRYNPKMITGQQSYDYLTKLAAENGDASPFPSGMPIADTNWWDEGTRGGRVLNGTVSLSKNEKDSKVYVSANYNKQVGILKPTDFERMSGRIGLEKKLHEKLNLGANLYGSYSKSNALEYGDNILGNIYGMIVSSPAIPVRNADGSYYRVSGRDNVIAGNLLRTNVFKTRIFNGNAFLDYQIIKNLSLHVGGGFEYWVNENGKYVPTSLVQGQKYNGVAQRINKNTFRWLNEQYLTYKYNNDVHSVTAVLGFSNQKDVSEGLGAGASQFSTDAYLYYNLYGGTAPAPGASLPSSYRYDILYRSFFTRVNYSFHDKYLFTFSLRDDQSSKFPSKNRHGIFPAGAIGWKVSGEPFMKDVKIISDLKLRLSYGITGNDRGTSEYDYLTRFGSYGYTISPGNFVAGLEPSSLANPNLKWETTAQLDIGADMTFLEGRIGVTVDYYQKKTTDLLLAVPIGNWWGFPTQTVNSGKITNRGFELSINSTNLKTNSLKWNTSFNFSMNRQVAAELADNVKIISTRTSNPSGVVSAQEFSRLEPGKELGVIYGYQYAGVLKTGETYAPQPDGKPGDPKFVDVNGNGTLSPDDRTYLGNTIPRLIAGLGNDFRYKSFDLNIFFQGAFNYNLYNMNRLVMESTTSTDVLNRWVKDTNENTDVPRDGYFKAKYGSYVNSRFVEDASHVRLKVLSIGYNLSTSQLKNLKFVGNLRIYASVQNLLTITKYSGTDPEANAHIHSSTSSNLNGGIDFNTFPAYKTFMAGITLTLN